MSITLAKANPVEYATEDAGLPPSGELERLEEGNGLPAAKGIVTAVIISAPIWALIGFTLYMLL